MVARSLIRLQGWEAQQSSFLLSRLDPSSPIDHAPTQPVAVINLRVAGYLAAKAQSHHPMRAEVLIVGERTG